MIENDEEKGKKKLEKKKEKSLYLIFSKFTLYVKSTLNDDVL